MSQQTNLNVAPYFDDFDAANDYHRVLFKPGVPVQAREYNVGSPSISYDGTKMYFTVCQTINDINICTNL